MDSLVSGVRALPQPERVTSVGSVAEALHHIAGAMSDTQVMTVGEGIVGWIGQSAGAFAHEARHIQAAVRKVQGAIANVIAALNEYQSVCNGLTQQIRSHQQNWDSNIAWYKKEVSEIQSQVGAASGGQFPLLDAVDGVEVAEAALRARLDERQADEARAYNKTVEAVDAAAASTAGKLRAALDGVVPGVTGPDGGRGVSSRAAVGLALFGGTKGILAAQSRWAAAEADAPAAAALIDRTDGKTKLPSQAALRQFNATYGARLASDPYFATMLMKHIGAEKLYSITAAVRGSGVSDSHKALLKVFTANMGAGLILATGGSSTTDTGTTTGFKALDNALTTDGTKTVRQWRSDFQAALNTYGQKEFNSDGTMVTDTKSASNQSGRSTGTETRNCGYELLGQYLAYGAKAHPELSVGDHFLNGVDGKNSVAHGMVDYDMKHPTNFNMKYNLNSVHEQSGALQGEKSKSSIFEDGVSWDYLQHMYEAMDNAPDKTPSQTFMNSESSFYWDHDHKRNTPDEAMSMARYLVGNRKCMTENNLYKFSFSTDDKGNALGRLIDEISGDTSNPDSVNIARESIKGYNDGLKRNYDNIGPVEIEGKISGQNAFGHENSGFRSHIGNIINEYTTDIIEEKEQSTGVNGAKGASWDIRDKRYHMVFDDETYEMFHDQIKTDSSGELVVTQQCDFMKDIGHDKKLVKTITKNTINQLTTDYYQAYTAYGDNKHKNDLKKYVVTNYSNFLTSLKQSEISAGVEKSKTTVGSTINLFKVLNTQIIGKIPIIGSSLQNAGNDQIQVFNDKLIEKAISEHSSGNSDTEIKVSHVQEIVHGRHIDTNEINKLKSPTVKEYDNPQGNSNLQNIPGAREYSDLLPEKERFFDNNGREIDPSDLSPEQDQARKRFHLSEWNGQRG